jgi:hypothetical protein
LKLLVALAALGALGALGPASAGADVFERISLVSDSALAGSPSNQQLNYAHHPEISGDGRFVVFDGSYAGKTGVWRRSLRNGAIEAVAVADPENPAISAPDASLPSISTNGQYVSFTTTAQLDPVDDTNRGPDVYVRNMAVPAGQPCEVGPGTGAPCAYTLVSAVDGSNVGLSYEPDGASIAAEEKDLGSVAAARSAISANGQEVAFVTTVISDLAGPGTPAMQVAMRDLSDDHTELVSVAENPASGGPIPNDPVSANQGSEQYGAVYSGRGTAPIFTAPQAYEQPAEVGASISADGSTVAWMGVNVSLQASLLAGEAPPPSYTEPLWRRIGNGPQAPTRRITGGSDPASPGCAGSGQSQLPSTPSLTNPCQGPFAGLQEGRTFGIVSSSAIDPVPRLDGDGYEVAFLANAPLAALAGGFGGEEPNSDVYLVDMHEPLTRAQALRPLSELAGGDQADIAENAQIEDFGISPDGQQVAFTTKRTVFPLGSPAYVSAPQGSPGMLELFDVDLADDTLTRVTEGFEGGPSEHPHEPRPSSEDPYSQIADGALSPSFTDDGETIAFSSTASNLVFGDGNTPPLGTAGFDGSDAFLVSRKLFSPQPTPQSISTQPSPPAIKATWRLGVTARSRANGSILLYVSVPGAGTLTAGAQSSVRVRSKHHGRIGTTLATRDVASAKRAAGAVDGELTTLTLTPRRKFTSLADRRPGLAGTVTVTFTAVHHSALRQKVQVTFLRTEKRKPKQKQTRKPKQAHR